MNGHADMVGRTTADKGGRTAGFLRGTAIIAALGLALLAAALLSKEASAHGTGLYGSHGHGILTCGNYGRLYLEPGPNQGLQRFYAAAVNLNNRAQTDTVTYRAHLYRWNGQAWAYMSSTGWYDKLVSWPYSSNLGFPTGSGNPFAVVSQRGTYAASTEIRWYDRPDGSAGYLGSSPNAWAQGTCTY
jgi:hypothetical protein